MPLLQHLVGLTPVRFAVMDRDGARALRRREMAMKHREQTVSIIRNTLFHETVCSSPLGFGCN